MNNIIDTIFTCTTYDNVFKVEITKEMIKTVLEQIDISELKGGDNNVNES